MSRSRGTAGVAAALVLVAAVLAVLALARGPLPLPVFAHLGPVAVRIADLQATGAVLVPPAAVALIAVLRLVTRFGGAVLWAAGAAAPIVLVIVARLNGLTDAVALVLVYAASAGGVVLRSLHRPGGSAVPLRWWSVLGVVPWGVVAFSQIGGMLAHAAVPTAVRVLTLLVLAASAVEFVVVYRRRDRPLGEAAGLLLAAAPGVLLAVVTLTAAS